MRDALQLLFALVCGEVIKDKDGASPTREKLLETKDLPPVPHARLGQDLQFRDGIERGSRITPTKQIIEANYSGRLSRCDCLGVPMQSAVKRLLPHKVDFSKAYPSKVFGGPVWVSENKKAQLENRGVGTYLVWVR